MMSKTYRILSALLCYPSTELQAGISDIRQSIAPESEALSQLEPLLNYIEKTDLISLQEQYVQVFDRTPSHSLHLFEHVHGEDRARGQAMVDLLEEYRKHGFDVASDELPDYVPLFLEFLSETDDREAQSVLGDAVHVLAHIGGKLRGNNSLYASVFDVLVNLSPVAPEPLTVPPIRDMDEALETFGPNPEGIEPLLNTPRPAIAPINFYAQRPQ
jgi:nitrate reductase delta subunit